MVWGMFCRMAVALCGTAVAVYGQQPFSQLIGNVPIQPVKSTDVLEVPYLTWGGDVAAFWVNGGLNTAAGSYYADQKLKLKFVSGDDFIGQVKNYLSGRTPFLRGTIHMLGQASEVIGTDSRTKPVIIAQLSWSAGDHIVAREGLKTLNDLKRPEKKVRIACQEGGPHVGLLYDSLRQAQLGRTDIEIVWVKELTGPQGPADRFRQDATIDACCVITPDMLGLTGGLDTTGSGAEGTVAGAHVLNSTQQMSRSIADVYAVRSDWYRANKNMVEKFVAGYLKGSAEIVRLRDEFQKTNRLNPPYRQVLAMSQQIFGKTVLPTLEVDAHGLLLDCSFVGLPGQISFFQDEGNLSGFNPKVKDALDLAVSWGYAKVRTGFEPPPFDYQQLAQLAGLEYHRPEPAKERFQAETVESFPGSELDERTIVSFTISFEPNQAEFSADRYGGEFQRALQSASQFGNAVVVIRGHSDPTKVLVDLIKAGMGKGLIKRTGSHPDYRYFFKGRPLSLEQTSAVVELIKSGAFEGTENRPKETMQAALNLSLARAESVKESLVQFARQQNVNLDASQLQPVGAGIAEPVIPKPKNMDEAKENMRVEFRVVRVPAEAIKDDEFDF